MSTKASIVSKLSKSEEKAIIKQKREVEVRNKGKVLQGKDLEELKDRFLLAMQENFGNVSKSCVDCDINRQTYKQLMKDKEYVNRLADEDFKEQYKDFVELKLAKLVMKGDRQAVLFASKTLLKDRGYVERSEITGKDGKDLQQINVNVKYTNNTLNNIDATAKEDKAKQIEE